MSIIIKQPKNRDFHANCTLYFEGLRKNGKTDFEFEDEFYYTMLEASGK